MQLNDGDLEGARFLKPETVKMMRTIQTGEIKTGLRRAMDGGWGFAW